MAGLLIFVKVAPHCAGPTAGEVDRSVPVELDPDAHVRDIIAKLRETQAILGEVAVEWQGKRLAGSDLLADVGLCPQSTALVVPGYRHFRLAGGSGHCAVVRDGKVICWGRGRGRLPALRSGVIGIGCGSEHSVCLLESGDIACWGTDDSRATKPPWQYGRPALQVAAGYRHNVALLKLDISPFAREDSGIVCWGHGVQGQCTVPSMTGRVVQVAAGCDFTAALLVDGTVTCWGQNPALPRFPEKVVQISCGGSHLIALLESGGVVVAMCGMRWGVDQGQFSPPDFGAPVQQVAAGEQHGVALLENGDVRCWGSNEFGQCTVPQLSCPAVEVAAKEAHSMALLQDGTVVVWGDQSGGQCRVPPELSVSHTATPGQTTAPQDESKQIGSSGEGAVALPTAPSSSSSESEVLFNFNAGGFVPRVNGGPDPWSTPGQVSGAP
eukprot:Hpha_TRINITY_DN11638_c0_g1::TRINITY_DN11638_c0_g1_i1::g.49362::m.49362